MSETTTASEWRGSKGGRRKTDRYSILAVAELVPNRATVCIEGSIREISRKGCYVNTPSTLAVDSPLQLVVSRDGETFQTSGRVIYVHERVGMGVVFVDPAEEQLITLNGWLADAARAEGL